MGAVERRSSCSVVLGEGEVTSSVEAAIVSHMGKRVYQVGGNPEYMSAVEGAAVAESKVRP